MSDTPRPRPREELRWVTDDPLAFVTLDLDPLDEPARTAREPVT